MDRPAPSATAFFGEYAQRLSGVLAAADWSPVEMLARDLQTCWGRGGQFFLCGNGGSAGNALHLANDFLYGIAKDRGPGMKVNALSANPAVLTCLANDTGYENIFSQQLAALGVTDDILLALSGSGNSANILRALEQARRMGIKSYAVLGYSGGRAKALADVAIHFSVHDMQISEDLQLIVGHAIMQWLFVNPPCAISTRGVP